MPAGFFTPSVLEINDLGTLDELRSVWRTLLEQTPRPAFCQTLDWLQCNLRHCGPQSRLRALCIDEHGETTGITVLIERSVGRRIELSLPSVGGDTLWPLGAHPWSQWLPVGHHLRRAWSRRHVLDLRGLPDPEGMTTRSLHAAGWNVHAQPWTGTTTLRLEGSWDKFWSRLSPAVRQLVEFGEQRLAAIGPTNFVRFRPQGSDNNAPRFPPEVYEHCLHVALNDDDSLPRADSWLNAPARHQYQRDLLPWAWRHAAADLCLLFAGPQPIAFRFHTLAFGHLRTAWIGVDAEFRELPLATLLLIRVLRDSFQRHDQELDVGPTHPDVARDWNGAPTPLRRFVIGTKGPIIATEPEDSHLSNIYADLD